MERITGSEINKRWEFATGNALTRKVWAKKLNQSLLPSFIDLFGLDKLPEPTKMDKLKYRFKEIKRRIKSAHNALRGRECDCLGEDQQIILERIMERPIGKDSTDDSFNPCGECNCIPGTNKSICKLRKANQKVHELQDFAIWMTGCGYEFTQHEYFNEQRDKLLKI